MDDFKLKQQLDRCRVPNDTKGFKFINSGRNYWIVRGRVPIDVANIIYIDPASNHIRVVGHISCVAPQAPWINWFMPDGTELGTVEEKEYLEKYNMSSSYKEHMSRFTFTDDPELRKMAKGFITLYHIDSEVGLRVFVDYLRWFKLI